MQNNFPAVIPEACPECEKEFQCYCKMNHHRYNVHYPYQRYPEKISITCDPNDDRYHCKECHMTSSDKSNLLKHIKAYHFHAKEFPCYLCFKLYTTKTNLELHLLNDHAQLRAVRAHPSCYYPNIDPEIIHHAVPKVFPCLSMECTKAFSCSCKASAHYYKAHLPPQYGTGSFRCKRQCNMCGVTPNQRHLMRHIRHIHLHEKDFKCARCAQPFTGKRNLMHHLCTVSI